MASVDNLASLQQQAKLTGPVRIEYRELPENGGQLIAQVTSAIR